MDDIWIRVDSANGWLLIGNNQAVWKIFLEIRVHPHENNV